MIHLALVAFLVGGPTALAQDPEPTSAAPRLYTTAFQLTGEPECDSEGDDVESCRQLCDPVAAQEGSCIDEAELVDLDKAWRVGSMRRPARALMPSANEHAVYRMLGEAYLDSLTDLSAWWDAGFLEKNIRETGYTRLPRLREAWQRATVNRRTYSLPQRANYLGPYRWFNPWATSETSRDPYVFFPHVRHIGASSDDFPSLILMHGRFVRRLGYDKKLHDFDIMDFDYDDSGPFFEQLFPTQQLEFIKRIHPLDLFFFERASGQSLDDKTPALEAFSRWESLVGEGTRRFGDFAAVAFIEAAQFATVEYTRNHMRALSAVALMATPPDAVDPKFRITRELVAAARGETDTADQVVELVRGAAGPQDGAFVLQVQTLPRPVIEQWLEKLQEDGFEYDMRVLADDVEANLSKNLNQGLARLSGMTFKQREKYINARKVGNVKAEDLDAVILQAALLHLLHKVDEQAKTEGRSARRRRYEMLILGTHARHAIASTFDATKASTPEEVEVAATGQWTAVLGMHGLQPAAIPQGLGAVDPLAICTTRDSLEALEEAVVRKIHVDLLVEIPKVIEGEEITGTRVIWEAQRQNKIPFAMVDDPSLNQPKIERLIDVGANHSLWRIRYTMWSGWHVLWSLQPSKKPNRHVLLPRTSAMCGDMVFATPDVAGTVVRAGLLQGNFRPSLPPSRHQWSKVMRQRLRALEDEEFVPVDAGEALAQSEEQAAQAKAQAEAAKGAADALANVSGKDLAANLAGGGVPDLMNGEFEVTQEDLDSVTEYLRGIVQEPLYDLTGNEGLLVMAMDVSAPGRKARLDDRPKAKTPYVRFQEYISRGEARVRGKILPQHDVEQGHRYLQGAAWTWYFDVTRDRPMAITPAYPPTPGVTGGPPKSFGPFVGIDPPYPLWKHRKTVDLWLSGSLGGSPYRHSWFCTATTEDEQGRKTCDGGDSAFQSRHLSESFAGDLSFYANMWFQGRPHMGIDIGAEVRLNGMLPGQGRVASLLHPYLSILDPSGPGDPTSETDKWKFTSQAGVLVGFRKAIHPKPMHRVGAGSTWGAADAGGDVRARRLQWGLRTGVLLGGGLGGLEASVVGEIWAGWAVRRELANRADRTPYHPAALYGPYFRVQAGFPTAADLKGTSYMLLLGLRVHMRVSAPPKLPEAPSE